jgi:hypothetical protein
MLTTQGGLGLSILALCDLIEVCTCNVDVDAALQLLMTH